MRNFCSMHVALSHYMIKGFLTMVADCELEQNQIKKLSGLQSEMA